jgi:hypothetical protein
MQPLMSRRIPKYRHFKPKNLGVVRLDGRDHYLGRYDSPESWEAYHRLIAQWLAGQGKPLPVAEPTDRVKTVSEVILAYQKFARTYYVRDGEPS